MGNLNGLRSVELATVMAEDESLYIAYTTLNCANALHYDAEATVKSENLDGLIIGNQCTANCMQEQTVTILKKYRKV